MLDVGHITGEPPYCTSPQVSGAAEGRAESGEDGADGLRERLRVWWCIASGAGQTQPPQLQLRQRQGRAPQLRRLAAAGQLLDERLRLLQQRLRPERDPVTGLGVLLLNFFIDNSPSTSQLCKP